MAEKHVTVCDRCGSEVSKPHGRYSVRAVAVESDSYLAGRMDLCEPCGSLLHSWLSKDNATTQGDRGAPRGMRGPDWREVCPHNVPCAGPCPTPHYARR